MSRLLRLSLAVSGDKQLREYVRIAKAAEEFGFDTLSVADDLMFKPAWPILFLIAQHTRQIRLGPAVVNPYLMHPALIAGTVAALDELSNGRAYLGLGRGAFLEFVGIEPTAPLTTVREAIEIVRRLLNGDRTPYSGRFFHATEEAALHSQPRRPNIPILIGTWSPRLSNLAGQLADEIKAGAAWSNDYAHFMWSHVEAGARQAGRNPEEVTLAFGPLTSIAHDPADARAAAARALAVYLPHLQPMTDYLNVDREEIEAVRTSARAGDYAGAAALISDATLAQFALFGTPQHCIEAIEQTIAQTPIGRIEFGIHHSPNEREALRLLGKRVLPHFRDR